MWLHERRAPSWPGLELQFVSPCGYNFSRFFAFVGPITGRPLTDPAFVRAPKLKPMLAFYRLHCASYNVQPEDIEKLRGLVRQFDPDEHGLDFDALFQLFKAVHFAKRDSRLAATFSSEDIAKLSRKLQESESEGKTPRVSQAAFVADFESSLTKALMAKKDTLPCLSGAFVSQALQEMGLMERGNYFAAGEFAVDDFAHEVI